MRTLGRLDIRCVNHLCKHLGCTQKELTKFRQHPERWYRHWMMKDRSGSERPISVPRGRFYGISKNLQKLLSRVALPPYLHGGVREHSPRTNALVHVGKVAVLKFDIEKFFPHIRPRRVYSLFYDRLGCSAEVAAILTRLTTLDRGLPQGSPTSTVVANLVIIPLAARLNGLAMSHDSDYSQFVDDGAISGPGYLERLRPLIEKVVHQEGFRASPKPHKRLTLYRQQEQVVTGVKVNRRLGAPSAKVQEVSGLLDTCYSQVAAGERLPEKVIRSLKGKIQYVEGLDPVAGTALRQRLMQITAN